MTAVELSQSEDAIRNRELAAAERVRLAAAREAAKERRRAQKARSARSIRLLAAGEGTRSSRTERLARMAAIVREILGTCTDLMGRAEKAAWLERRAQLVAEHDRLARTTGTG